MSCFFMVPSKAPEVSGVTLHGGLYAPACNHGKFLHRLEQTVLRGFTAEWPHMRSSEFELNVLLNDMGALEQETGGSFGDFRKGFSWCGARAGTPFL